MVSLSRFCSSLILGKFRIRFSRSAVGWGCFSALGGWGGFVFLPYLELLAASVFGFAVVAYSSPSVSVFVLGFPVVFGDLSHFGY